jgi:uncharacterized protein YcbK (DUF882 family)
MFRIIILLTALLFPFTCSAASVLNPYNKHTSCIPTRLLTVALKAAQHFKADAIIISAYRSPKHNRRVRGAKRSLHMKCAALDFGVKGVSPDRLVRYVATIHRGGLGLYDRSSYIHVDTGKPRRWHWH